MPDIVAKRIPTGGPAFPIECNIVNGFRDDSGMTLRDWFAGKALAAIAETYNGGCIDPKSTASSAYAFADAMLAEKFKADEINAQAAREIEHDPF